MSANGTPKTVQLLTEKDFEKVPVGQGRNPEKAQAVLLRQLKNAKTAARKQKLRLRLLKYIE